MIVKKYDSVNNEVVQTVGAQHAAIRWLVGKDSPAPTFYLRQLELAPGGFTPFHAHPWEHEIYVLEGNGRLKTGPDAYIPLEKGSFALVMPDEEHQFQNTGDTTFKFLCIIPRHGA